MAFKNGKNPFMDDPDDDFFSAKATSGTVDSSRGYGNKFGPESGDLPPYDEAATSRAYGLKQQMQQSMNRQLDTTQRCLASIYDSEQIGIATAEVLCTLTGRCISQLVTPSTRYLYNYTSSSMVRVWLSVRWL